VNLNPIGARQRELIDYVASLIRCCAFVPRPSSPVEIDEALCVEQVVRKFFELAVGQVFECHVSWRDLALLQQNDIVLEAAGASTT
jgi:hypothetical protein